jgi:hypothetical protein
MKHNSTKGLKTLTFDEKKLDELVMATTLMVGSRFCKSSHATIMERSQCKALTQHQCWELEAESIGDIMRKYRVLQLGLQLGFPIAMKTCN